MSFTFNRTAITAKPLTIADAKAHTRSEQQLYDLLNAALEQSGKTVPLSAEAKALKAFPDLFDETGETGSKSKRMSSAAQARRAFPGLFKEQS